MTCDTAHVCMYSTTEILGTVAAGFHVICIKLTRNTMHQPGFPTIMQLVVPGHYVFPDLEELQNWSWRKVGVHLPPFLAPPPPPLWPCQVSSLQHKCAVYHCTKYFCLTDRASGIASPGPRRQLRTWAFPKMYLADSGIIILLKHIW